MDDDITISGWVNSTNYNAAIGAEVWVDDICINDLGKIKVDCFTRKAIFKASIFINISAAVDFAAISSTEVEEKKETVPFLVP